ncbi:serine/threonine protein kinase [Minicystis rosea]|nr:serine/threonine protein kinase [Minicystis rosea]
MAWTHVIGTTLDGKYRIERLVGAGAMGAVYEAEHTGTGRRVAVKVISSGDVARDQKLVTRFQREAKAAGAIDTQHITQVLDTGVDESGSPYLVMELLHGEDLQHAIKRLGPLSPDVALRVVAQTCLGLQKAHEAHVVHRDIKPANLFLAQRDAGELRIKLLDFGIAKVKMDHANDAESAALTKTGSMLGSPLYMSPEQAKGLKSIDHRADLWSLGVVLYQALTGRTPYDHCDALGGLIIAICHDDVTPVQELAPWVPPDVAAIVHKALRRDPAERYQSATEMFDAIKPLIPNGWSLYESMFVSLSDTAKAIVAPRISVEPQPPPKPSIPPAAARLSDPVGPGSAAASTTGALSHSQSVPSVAAPKGSRAPVIGAVIGAGLLVVGYAVTRPPPPAPVPAATATATQSAPPPPVATPAPIATEAPKTAEPAPKRVKLVILPADASVEVEGTKTPLKDGLLEITGAPGSVHRVRVFKGKQETTADVIVTEAGPSPPKVELSANAPAGTKPAASTGPRAPTAATAVPSGIKSTFE